MGRKTKISSLIWQTGFKTVYFNFKYLPFQQAIHFPIILSRKVYLNEVKGKIIIKGKISTGMIKIGYRGVEIFDHQKSRAIWQVSGAVIFNGRARIGHGSKISVGKEGTLIFGDNFTVTAESTIIASTKTIEFGSNCLLSWDVLMMDTDFHDIKDKNNVIINNSEDIRVGSHVWIGCRVLVLKGSVIPHNAIIAAGSLVSKKLEGEYKIFGGLPVKELQSDVHWEL